MTGPVSVRLVPPATDSVPAFAESAAARVPDAPLTASVPATTSRLPEPVSAPATVVNLPPSSTSVPAPLASVPANDPVPVRSSTPELMATEPLSLNTDAIVVTTPVDRRLDPAAKVTVPPVMPPLLPSANVPADTVRLVEMLRPPVTSAVADCWPIVSEFAASVPAIVTVYVPTTVMLAALLALGTLPVLQAAALSQVLLTPDTQLTGVKVCC